MLTNAAAFLNDALSGPLTAVVPVGECGPVELYPAFRRGAGSFLLESGLRSGAIAGSWGRYSYLGGNPYRALVAVGDSMEDRSYTEAGHLTSTPAPSYAPDVIVDAVNRWRDTAPPGWRASGFAGGAVGYLGYGLSRRHLRTGRPRTGPLPDLWWMFVDLVGVFDHVDRTFTVLFCPPAERWLGESREHLLREGRERLHEAAAAIEVTRRTASPELSARQRVRPSPTMTSHAYVAMVERAQAYISAGDIFQANLAQEFTADVGDRDGFAWYRRLRAVNPAPFSAFLDLGKVQLISSSPERLVKLSSRDVETRPIAGTRPRGADADADDRLTADLLCNAKERAEHLMLVDLERNDLGRVCTYGSVKVDELMVTERYSHVMHIVSNIRGTLRTDAGPADVLDAVFPGGTVTGVPKIRCLEIIEELEPVPRGIYTGAIGYLSWSGQMDWSIAIRTLVRLGHRLSFHVGAGIVADSHPEREYRETMDKAQALFEALS